MADDRQHVLGPEAPRPAVHLRVAKAVVGEPGLPLLGLAAPHRVPVGGPCRSQRPDAQLAVLEDLGVAQRHRLPRSALDADAQAPHEVLTEVHDRAARRRAQDLHGFDDPDAAHRGTRGGDQPPRVVGEDADARPPGVVVAGRGPPGPLQPRVVGLAVVEVGGQDGAARRSPPVVGADALVAAVGIPDVQLCQERQAVSVDVAPAAPEAEPAPEPAVAQHRAYHVSPGPQQPRDVERLVPEAVAVARPPGGEHVVAHADPVELDLVHTVGGDGEARAGDLASQLERPPQQGLRPRQRGVVLPVGGDQLRGPVVGAEQPRLHLVLLAPGRRPAASGPPHPDPGAPALTGAQLAGLPGHEHRLVGHDAPTRPGDPSLSVQQLQLVGRLPPVRQVGDDLPGEARAALADPERLPVVLEPEACDADRQADSILKRFIAGRM